MITVVVVEDEKKVYDLLSNVLTKSGYTLVDEVASGGMIKIIKRASRQVNDTGINLADSGDYFMKNNGGELYKTTVMDIEKNLISSVLARTDGNQLKAAKILGINRNTLRTKILKLGIDVARWKTY